MIITKLLWTMTDYEVVKTYDTKALYKWSGSVDKATPSNYKFHNSIAKFIHEWKW